MTVKEFFEKEKIFEYSILPFSEVTVIDEKKAGRIFDGRAPQVVVPFLIPYYVKTEECSNISVYAHSKDYHFYFSAFAERLRDEFGEISACCDISPINEVECAVRGGLGSIGKNGLLINERYGTYVFIAEAFFNVPADHPIFEGIEKRDRGHFCSACGACERACPMNAINDKTKCISFINQKKRLEDGEEKIIKESGSVWGCDICQAVCPMNKAPEETEIEFFREDRTPYLTDELIDKMMVEDTFRLRAYAWRGEAVVRRNIRLCQKNKNAPQ